MMGNCARFGDVSGDWGYRKRRIGERERVLSCSLTENWTEEGELQCGCPHSVFLWSGCALFEISGSQGSHWDIILYSTSV